MASFNKVILVGNLTKDPELKYTASGLPVCDIRMAINERAKTKDGDWIETPLFLTVTLWGRTAETADKYLAKGSGVLIEGKLKLDEWEDRETREKHSTLRIVGESMQMLGGPSREGNQERKERPGEYSQERQESPSEYNQEPQKKRYSGRR